MTGCASFHFLGQVWLDLATLTVSFISRGSFTDLNKRKLFEQIPIQTQSSNLNPLALLITVQMSSLTLADLMFLPLFTFNYVCHHLPHLDFHSQHLGLNYPMSPWLNPDWAAWSGDEVQSISPSWENLRDRLPCRSRTKPSLTDCPCPTLKVLEKTDVGQKDRRWCSINEDVRNVCMHFSRTHSQVLILTLTFRSLLDLECNRVSGGLQEVDGLAQRFSLETHVIDGQNTVTDMKSTSPLHIKSHVKVR